jgi:tetratricopeptide (TPR) repeat protein
VRFPVYLPRVLAALGAVYTMIGRPEDGLLLLERAAKEGEANRILYEHALVLIQLGEAHLAGNPENAERHASRSLEVARQYGEKGNEAWAAHLLSRVAAAQPLLHEDVAVGHATRAMALATELGMRPLVAHCNLGIGMLYRRTGKPEQAHEHLTTAKTMYREMGMTYWLEQAENDMARIGE